MQNRGHVASPAPFVPCSHWTARCVAVDRICGSSQTRNTMRDVRCAMCISSRIRFTPTRRRSSHYLAPLPLVLHSAHSTSYRSQPSRPSTGPIQPQHAAAPVQSSESTSLPIASPNPQFPRPRPRSVPHIVRTGRRRPFSSVLGPPTAHLERCRSAAGANPTGMGYPRAGTSVELASRRGPCCDLSRVSCPGSTEYGVKGAWPGGTRHSPIPHAMQMQLSRVVTRVRNIRPTIPSTM